MWPTADTAANHAALATWYIIMVERRHVSSRVRPRSRVAVLSPGSLPPRWGEGVAPPTTPHYTQNNTPETSPRVNNDMQISPDSDPGDARVVDTCPATGAELLHDLHRRLMAQSVNGTLPRRPAGHSRHAHRKTRVSRQKTRDYMTLPPPDLLPSSAFNHPSRHTQYSVTQSRDTRADNTQFMTNICETRTSDYSPSPTHSTSPPLPSSSLSYPSPPLQRQRSSNHPLTSTMLGSPESSSSGSHLSHPLTGIGHTNSPASPELSSIHCVRPLDVTQYQNIENGIVYISSSDLARSSSSRLPVSSSTANLSRFNVSPPSSAVAAVAPQPSRTGIRLTSKNKLKGKTVSWVADRKMNAKYISDDRKVVKNQVLKMHIN